MQTYYFVLGSQNFLLEKEPLEEVFRERIRDYQEKNKEIDFWVVKQPAFLESPEFAEAKAKCPQPCAAIISTDPNFIIWLKLRLEYVIKGEFQAPSQTIPNPTASLAAMA
ncbi:MAG: MgPME-cyclase complex family protein [Prochloraceae cyanobacterium]